MSKIATAAEAAALVPSGAVLAVDGFVGSACPEELLLALEARFLETGEPRGADRAGLDRLRRHARARPRPPGP